jgi:thioester reductase-like protein
VESLLAEVDGLIPSDPKHNGTLGMNGSIGGRVNDLIVVLTGATRFLSGHILQKLVLDHRVREVHCIAIRPDVSGKPRHVKVQQPKIIEHIGDLASPRAGLSQTEFNKLSEHADLIIHTAYVVNFLKSYNSVRPTNVASMSALLAWRLGVECQCILFRPTSSPCSSRQANSRWLRFLPPSCDLQRTSTEKTATASAMRQASGYARHYWSVSQLRCLP